MKRAIVCLILTVLLSPQGVIAEETKQAEILTFDYSKYLAPKAWRAIQESQGVLLTMVPSFGGGSKHSLAQTLVFDAKKGLLLSVAHGISEYPPVAFGKETVYTFIYHEKVYPCELIDLSILADLAIFRVKKGDLSKFKAVSFAKTVEPFKEYYGFSQRAEFDQSGGTEVTHNIPWRANLIQERENTTMVPLNLFVSMAVTVKTLMFDKSIIYGFSGAGIFNNRGEVIGMLTASMVPGGFSTAVSADTMQAHIERYRAGEKEKEDREKAKGSAAKVAKPVDKPNKK